MLLKETSAFVIPPCNVMLRLTEAERLEDEGNLTAVETVARDSNGSAALSSLSVCGRNTARDTSFGPCVSFKKMCLPGPKPCLALPSNNSRSQGEIFSIVAYSSRMVASIEKLSVRSTFSACYC